MALKYKVKAKDEIPAELAGHYVERDGAWLLDVDGAADKAKLDEFRASNTTLLKELADQKKRFEGIDPDEVRKLAEEKRKLEDEKQLKAGEFDKVLDGRLKAARSDWEKQLSAVNAERDTLNQRLMVIQIDQGVVAAATKRGLRATAIPDITARARTIFKLANGVPTAFDGDTVRAGKDGVSPMTLEEWVDAQVSEAPHLFESNAGSGAAGASDGVGRGVNNPAKNPFRRDAWNLTAQMQLQKTDPLLAARLKATA